MIESRAREVKRFRLEAAGAFKMLNDSFRPKAWTGQAPNGGRERYHYVQKVTRPAFALTLLALSAAAEEPRITSVYPSVVTAGTTAKLTIRGKFLTGANAIFGVPARVVDVEKEEVVRVEFAGAASGKHTFRLITSQGVSNELPLSVVDEAVLEEGGIAAPLSRFPTVIAGKLSARGEVDSVWIEAKPGETITFTCSGGFDPSLILSEPSGSWFDEGRLNRIAFNDEPLHFPGLSQDARLVHRFERAGKYAIQVRAFGGQGGPDATYQLRIVPGTGDAPLLHPRTSGVWEERKFTRLMPANWMAELAGRGGRAEIPAAPETFRELGESVMAVPGVVEGRITKAAEAHRFKVRIDAPKDLAIEIETPEATMPRFNPVVRFMAADGSELVTNVYTKRNNNGLYMMKMIQAKSTFTVRAAGEYLMEIRDITTDVAGPDFAYRVLVRPQIPHVGKAEVAEDHVNLEAGQAKALTVNVEREEGFTGLVLVSAEGLPPGVSATAGMANPIEKPPLPNGGRVERYVGKPQTTSLMLLAAEDAKPSETPAVVRVVVRTVTNGKQSQPILVKEVPVMVLPRRAS